MPNAKKKTTRRGSPRERPPRPSTLRSLARELRDYAMAFPGATEDFPWGERVAKVNGKVFVFLGCEPASGPAGEMGLSVKLPVSCEEALELPFTKPTGYGLGKAGWVSLQTKTVSAALLAELTDWIDESYRAIAPKTLVKALDARPARHGARR